MCDPVSLTIAATAVTAAGTLTGGMAKAGQQRYAAQVADQRAQIASDQAKDAITQGQLADRDLQRKTAQQMGAQRVAAAAGGIDPGWGSAAQASGDIAMLGQDALDQQRHDRANQVKGFDVQGWGSRSEAAANRAAANNSMLSAVFDTAGTVLGGAQKIAGMPKVPEDSFAGADTSKPLRKIKWT